MRALCGAIISAGALIGMGLTAIGIGNRYAYNYPYLNQEGKPQWVEFKYIDTALMFAMVASGLALLIGLAIAFLGLAYHHQRRDHEMLHREQGRGPQGRIPV